MRYNVQLAHKLDDRAKLGRWLQERETFKLKTNITQKVLLKFYLYYEISIKIKIIHNIFTYIIKIYI